MVRGHRGSGRGVRERSDEEGAASKRKGAPAPPSPNFLLQNGVGGAAFFASRVSWTILGRWSRVR
eukprot:2666392-Alexandrium_andersonii.AAC.1